MESLIFAIAIGWSRGEVTIQQSEHLIKHAITGVALWLYITCVSQGRAKHLRGLNNIYHRHGNTPFRIRDLAHREQAKKAPSPLYRSHRCAWPGLCRPLSSWKALGDGFRVLFRSINLERSWGLAVGESVQGHMGTPNSRKRVLVIGGEAFYRKPPHTEARRP